MRTTLTIDPDVEQMLQRVVRERGISFKEAVNSALRTGLRREAGEERTPFVQKTLPVELNPAFNFDKALQLASALEDEEIIRKLAAGK